MSYRLPCKATLDEEKDSSDSEGELPVSPQSKIPRLSDENKKSIGSKAAHMWTTFLEQQSLTEGLSTGTDLHGRKNDRGVESYDVPEDKVLFPEDNYNKGNVRDESCKNRDRKKHNVKGKPLKSGTSKASTSFSTERRDRQRGNQIKLGKRPYSEPQNSLVSKDYSVEGLMSAEFPENMPIDRLAEEMAKALGEYDDSIIPSVVKELGEEHALKLFYEVRDIEAAGGMKVLDGSRRRTPGGVYMVLFKSDTDVCQEVKQKIMKLTKTSTRTLKKAKRTIKNEVLNQINEADFPIASEILLGRKNGDGEVPQFRKGDKMET